MYELPSSLRTLYRHWEKHIKPEPVQAEGVELNADVLREMEAFAAERMEVWHRRYINQTQPYTNDKILQAYRFCNVYRELDRQTIEIHQLLNPIRDDFELWLLNAFFCRFVCNPNTIKEVGLLSYDKRNNQKVFDLLSEKPNPKYGSAYVFPISIIQKNAHPTRESFFCFYLPQVMKRVAQEIQGCADCSVTSAVEKVIAALGFNFRFHTTEVLIDVAYQYPERINLFDRFPIGPGSEPSMHRLSPHEPEETCLALASRTLKAFPYLTYNKQPVLLSAENWEGIGCEFRKYTNLKNGLGRKRKYAVHEKPLI